VAVTGAEFPHERTEMNALPSVESDMARGAAGRNRNRREDAMNRDPALLSLSRDHHLALVVAQTLRRARPETAKEARAEFLTYWWEHGHVHFRLEEEVLLPAFAGYGDPHHPVVARVLCDHALIRHRADELAPDLAPTVAFLHELGDSLSDHVRLEERELFPLIEQAMPADALVAMSHELNEAEYSPDDD
jgi:hemerythrin-like domain-containing protein